MRASRLRIFLTVTLPGCRYGLISAAFVVFTLSITDFGAPKVIGGDFNVLATDVYKQVIGQQNFEMGAVVSVVLLIPAVLAFAVDRVVQRRQVALLSSRAVALEPKPNRTFDAVMLGYCILVSVFLIGMLGTCQYAALVKFYPYDLSFGLQNYDFDVMTAAAGMRTGTRSGWRPIPRSSEPSWSSPARTWWRRAAGSGPAAPCSSSLR